MVPPSAPSRSKLRSQGRTHAGAVRARNEDVFVDRADIGLWAVADGMGGHADGADASRRVADALGAVAAPASAHDLLARVRAALEGVDADLRALADTAGEQARSGSTVVALMISDGCYACLWAGDSRLHRLRAGRLERMTRDDSLVQDLMDAGVLTPERARRDRRGHILTRALGCGPSVRLNFTEGRVELGDVYLLSSDGLTNSLDDGELDRRLRGADPAQGLIDAALQARASDNVTALVVQV